MSTNTDTGGPKAKGEKPAFLSDAEQEKKIDDILRGFPDAAMVNAMWKMACVLHKSGMFRQAQSPAGCFTILMYGHEIGLKPIQSMSNIDIVEGKPAMSSQLMQSLAESAGVEIKILERTEKVSKLELRYSGKPPQEFTFTFADAETAGLVAKKGYNYQRYPRAMLYWRCLADALRVYAPGVLLQAYTYDEVSNGAVSSLAGFLEAVPVEYEEDDSPPVKVPAQRGSLTPEDMKPGDPGTHQGHEPSSPVMSKEELAKEIGALEDSIGLGNTVPDLRTDHVGYLDLEHEGVDPTKLAAYLDHLRSLKVKNGGDAGF
jgi:hypothetical protein